MAKNKISEYSSIASSNTDIGGIDINEGCAPSSLNNAIRELMAQLKDMIIGADGDNLTVGNNLSVTGTSNLTGVVTASSGITGNLTGTVTGSVTGNAGTVTNGVYVTGNQTIGGIKTFSSSIAGSITGNAETVTNGVYTVGNQTIGGVKTFSSNIVGNLTGNVTGNVTGTSANVTGTVSVANGGTGLTTLTANNVMLGNGTSTPSFVAPSTSGNVLTSNGTTWTSAQLNRLTSDTAKSSTSGTSIDFTGIPSWVKRINVMFNGVSTNGSSDVIIQLGDSGGFEATGYLGSTGETAASGAGSSQFTTGIGLSRGTSSIAVRHGLVTIAHMGSNLWAAGVSTSRSDVATAYSGASNKTLSDTLTQIRITTVNGTDTFDAGSINIMYE